MTDNLYIMKSRPLLKMTTTLIKLSPVCVLISAAKHESYSLVYSKLLRKAFGGWSDNAWSHVNYLHLLDEVQHVPFQLEVYEEATNNMGPFQMIKAIVATLAFFVLMQLIALLSAWNLISCAMPKSSLIQKCIWFGRLIKWVLLDYRPAFESRNNVRNLLDKNQIPLGGLYKVLYR